MYQVSFQSFANAELYWSTQQDDEGRRFGVAARAMSRRPKAVVVKGTTEPIVVPVHGYAGARRVVVEPNQTKPNQTKQNKTKQNKTKQNKTKQNKTKQNKTKQNKTKQNKTKQNKTKASRAPPSNDTRASSARARVARRSDAPPHNDARRRARARGATLNAASRGAPSRVPGPVALARGVGVLRSGVASLVVASRRSPGRWFCLIRETAEASGCYIHLDNPTLVQASGLVASRARCSCSWVVFARFRHAGDDDAVR